MYRLYELLGDKWKSTDYASKDFEYIKKCFDMLRRMSDHKLKITKNSKIIIQN